MEKKTRWIRCRSRTPGCFPGACPALPPEHRRPPPSLASAGMDGETLRRPRRSWHHAVPTEEAGQGGWLLPLPPAGSAVSGGPGRPPPGRGLSAPVASSSPAPCLCTGLRGARWGLAPVSHIYYF